MDGYFLLKALHTISFVCWMVGLVSLPWLFAVHASARPGTELAEALKSLEARLYKSIMHPALGTSWVFGVWMIIDNPALLRQGWLHGKLTLVVLLTALHLVLGHWQRAFRRDENGRSAGFYRLISLVSLGLMAAIVVLAVVKPF